MIDSWNYYVYYIINNVWHIYIHRGGWSAPGSHGESRQTPRTQRSCRGCQARLGQARPGQATLGYARLCAAFGEVKQSGPAACVTAYKLLATCSYIYIYIYIYTYVCVCVIVTRIIAYAQASRIHDKQLTVIPRKTLDSTEICLMAWSACFDRSQPCVTTCLIRASVEVFISGKVADAIARLRPFLPFIGCSFQRWNWTCSWHIIR